MRRTAARAELTAVGQRVRRRREVGRVLGREAAAQVARPQQRPLRVVVDERRAVEQEHDDGDADDRQRAARRAAGSGARRSSRISERRRRRRGRGGETVAIRPATIAVVPAGSRRSSRLETQSADSGAAAATAAARVGAAPCPSRCTRSPSPRPSRGRRCSPTAAATRVRARDAATGARRALAMLAAPALAVLAIGTLADERATCRRSAPKVIGAARRRRAIAVLVAHVASCCRRPDAFALLAVAALPFRVPVSIGDTAANLLLPLYGVIAGGHPRVRVELAARRATSRPTDAEREPIAALAAVRVRRACCVLYALQSLYSTDLEQALKNFCLFYVPFAVLFLLLLDTIVDAASCCARRSRVTVGARARVRGDRLRRVRHRPPADHQREGRRRPTTSCPTSGSTRCSSTRTSSGATWR